MAKSKLFALAALLLILVVTVSAQYYNNNYENSNTLAQEDDDDEATEQFFFNEQLDNSEQQEFEAEDAYTLTTTAAPTPTSAPTYKNKFDCTKEAAAREQKIQTDGSACTAACNYRPCADNCLHKTTLALNENKKQENACYCNYFSSDCQTYCSIAYSIWSDDLNTKKAGCSKFCRGVAICLPKCKEPYDVELGQAATWLEYCKINAGHQPGFKFI